MSVRALRERLDEHFSQDEQAASGAANCLAESITKERSRDRPEDGVELELVDPDDRVESHEATGRNRVEDVHCPYSRSCAKIIEVVLRIDAFPHFSSRPDKLAQSIRFCSSAGSSRRDRQRQPRRGPGLRSQGISSLQDPVGRNLGLHGHRFHRGPPRFNRVYLEATRIIQPTARRRSRSIVPSRYPVATLPPPAGRYDDRRHAPHLAPPARLRWAVHRADDPDDVARRLHDEGISRMLIPSRLGRSCRSVLVGVRGRRPSSARRSRRSTSPVIWPAAASRSQHAENELRLSWPWRAHSFGDRARHNWCWICVPAMPLIRSMATSIARRERLPIWRMPIR